MNRVVKSVATLVIALHLPVVAVVCADTNSAEIDRQATQIYQDVMSPFCPGRALNDCPSSKAHELKAKIRSQLEAGVPAERVLDDILAEYGEQYRAVPLYRGFGRVAWAAPVVFIMLGLGLALYVVARRSRAVVSDDGKKQAPLSDEMRRKIENELAKLE